MLSEVMELRWTGARHADILGLVLLALATTALAGRARDEPAEDNVHGPNSLVQRLSAANFRSMVVESNRAALVEFYLPGNPMTINLAPIMDALAVDYGSIITVGAVSMELERELTDFFSHRENKAPFLVLFPPGTRGSLKLTRGVHEVLINASSPNQ